MTVRIIPLRSAEIILFPTREFAPEYFWSRQTGRPAKEFREWLESCKLSGNDWRLAEAEEKLRAYERLSGGDDDGGAAA